MYKTKERCSILQNVVEFSKKAKPIGFVIKPWRDYSENAFSSIAGTDVMSQQI